MLKYLDKDFNTYCNSNNLVINQNQLLVINKLQDFYNKNYKSFIYNLFSKENPKKAFYL